VLTTIIRQIYQSFDVMLLELDTMKETCFVISPFCHPFDGYYKKIYKPAIEKAKLTAIRADEICGTGPIIEDIFTHIDLASVVVCEVTGKNPNVNYELGIAHALEKPAIIITRTMDDVPFDYKHLRTIQYDTNLVGWERKLKEQIYQTILSVREYPQRAIVWQRPTKVEVDEKELSEGVTTVPDSVTKLSLKELAALRELAEREAPDELRQREKVCSILINNRELPKELINKSLAGSGFFTEYGHISDNDKKMLESSLLKCIDWLTDSLSDIVGKTAPVKHLKLKNAVLREARISTLEYMKDHQIPKEFDDEGVVHKIQEYLTILTNKLAEQ
jgi:hypothetical protein